MSYTPIAINRKTLTIMDVPFPDLETLENTAEAIGSNMFEGFHPTKKGIEIIRDYCSGKMTFAQMVTAAKENLMNNDYQYIDPHTLINHPCAWASAATPPGSSAAA